VSSRFADFETLRYEERGSVAWVTLDRPDALNAFTATMQDEFRTVWQGLRTNDDVRAVVLTGAGDKAFCAGIDRNEPFTALDGGAIYGTSNNFMYDDPGDALGPKSNDLWKPVIGAVNGLACGGAFYFLAECDILIAAEHATFFDPHVTYGMAAVYEPMKMLTRMPFGEVMRMSLTGNAERITADSALRMGLVSEVVPSEERIRGEHIARYAEMLATQNPELYERRFSVYLKMGLDPRELPKHFEEVKARILEDYKDVLAAVQAGGGS
jgi:enoyl-CoA hydratase/carnithine racemase